MVSVHVEEGNGGAHVFIRKDCDKGNLVHVFPNGEIHLFIDGQRGWKIILHGDSW